MKIKPLGKIIILILVVGAAFGAWKVFGKGGSVLDSLIPSAKIQNSTVPIKADLPAVAGSAPAVPIDGLKMPGSSHANVSSPEIRMLIYAWNSQMGLLFANGGPKTTDGSLMAQNNVNLSIARQDDNGKLQEALVGFATELSRGKPQPDQGAHFVAIMGDGSAAFLAALNDSLKKIGPEYKARIVGSAGYSRGEDKFMGPSAWKDNPHAALGGVVAGVIRDGDWNIAQKWLGDNNLKNNPDEKTYDPDALNWIAANDYVDAAAKYVSGYTEEREVVKNGKKTGEKKTIHVDGVVTWTPGDVTVAEKKGGLASIVSTKEYSAQMPQVIIGIDKWCKENREEVENMLAGMFRGGDAVKSSSEALHKAAEVATAVYGEQNADYWEKYYKGMDQADKTGVSISLGGSSVNNLADDMYLFGLVPGSANTFAATYRVFGDIVKAQYPTLVPSYPSVEEILDTSYVVDVSKKLNFDASKATPVAAKPAPNAGPMRVISSKNWNITFASGRAAFTGSAATTLQRLLNDLLVAGNTAVEIHGHTDNQGNYDANQQLSEARAFAVKNWLEARAPKNFPEGRIKVFAHGQTQPLAPNSTNEGRAKNRRVEIKIGGN